MHKLGEYIEKLNRPNSDLKYGIDDVAGITNTKEITIGTKANLNGRTFEKFTILKPREFIFNRRTSRNGERISLGYNQTARDWILTEDYCHFRIREDKKNELDSDYLYLYFLRPEFDRYVRFNSWGSATEFFNWEEMIEVPIPVPSFVEQQKIVYTYKVVTNRIDLLKKISENLEQQAMALFKSWFIDFEPFDGQVPKTWVNGVFGDFVEIKRGGSPRPIQNFLSDSGFHWLKISDATGISSPFINEIKEYIIEAGLKKTVYLKSGSLVLSNSATPGLPKILDINTCIHDGWLYFPSSKFSNEYLYLYFKHIRDNLVALGNGSVFTNLKTDILKNYPTYLPTENILKEFDELVHPIFAMILSKTRETKRLSEIRDTLLPRLMSGEIDVSGIDI